MIENNKKNFKRDELDLCISLVKVYKTDDRPEYYFIALPYGKPNRVYLNIAEYDYLCRINGIKGDDK